jgi:hypothetical protein
LGTKAAPLLGSENRGCVILCICSVSNRNVSAALSLLNNVYNSIYSTNQQLTLYVTDYEIGLSPQVYVTVGFFLMPYVSAVEMSYSIGIDVSTVALIDNKGVWAHCKNRFRLNGSGQLLYTEPQIQNKYSRNETGRPHSLSTIHVSVSDLYVPKIGPQTQYSKIGKPIVGVSKSLTDT